MPKFSPKFVIPLLALTMLLTWTVLLMNKEKVLTIPTPAITLTLTPEIVSNEFFDDVPLGAGGTTLFNDTFTVGADELVDAHTPDTGTSWTKVYNAEGDDDLNVNATNDDVRPEALDAGAGAAYSADATYSDTDYQVQFTCKDCGSSDDYVYGLIRSTGTLAAANGGYVLWDMGDTTTEDPKISVVTGATTCTTLDTYDSGGAGKTYFPSNAVALFQVVGDELTAFADNVGLLYIASNRAITAANKGGMGMGALPCNNAGDFAGTTTQLLDSFSVTEVAASSTSWSNPTTTGEISNSFTNPTNAYSSNDTDATETTVGESQDYGDFGINLPAGSTVRGVSVRVEGASTASSWKEIGMEVSNDNGATWSSQLLGRVSTTVDDFLVYGHANYLWGLTWTSTDVADTDLRVRIEMNAEESTLSDLEVDHVSVRVYYDPAASTTDTVSKVQIQMGEVIIKDGEVIIQ